MRYSKGEVLFFTFIILLVISLLIAIAGFLLQAHTDIQFQHQKSILAFYLASAGLERAKIEAKNGVVTSPLWAGPYSLGEGRYYFYVENIGGDRRRLRAIGQVLDTSGNVMAERRAEVLVRNVSTSNPQEIFSSWREN